MILGKGKKRRKPTDARRMTLLISVYTITHKVRANVSKNYIHKVNR